jgi:hypothetical protein
LLPLQWRENTQNSPHLPDKLQRLARNAAQLVHHPNWGLHLSGEAGLADHDLSPFDRFFQVESGWAALAVGLLLAAEGGTPDPAVWASGRWDPVGGIAKVGHLKPKLRLAVEWGAREFFLPESQIEQARSILDPAAPLKLGKLRVGTCDPKQAVAEYLHRLDAPPPPPADADDAAAFARCAAYYSRQPPDAIHVRRYYREALLPYISEKQRRHVQDAYPGWQPSHLVTVVSYNEVLVELVACALGVSHVLLLHTADPSPRERSLEVQSRLAAAGVSCTPCLIPDDQQGMLADVEAALRQLKAVPPGQVVIDLTPGTKLMTYALARAAPAGSWLVYLKHESSGRPQPGTERLIRWQADG